MKQIRPHAKLLRTWRVYLILLSILPAFALSLFMQVGSTSWFIAAGAWGIVFLCIYLLYLPARRRGLSFSIDARAITRKSGVFFLKTETLPLCAVCFTAIIRSPVVRMFGLCSLRIAAPGVSLSVPGLMRTDAQALALSLRQWEEGPS